MNQKDGMGMPATHDSPIRVCFVHKGNSSFLQYAVSQARSCGYLPVIIGDQDAKCEFAEFHDIAEFSTDIESFRSIYSHISANPFDYEIFCFERWFIIRNYMRRFDGPIWVADHDVLVYEGLEELAATLESSPLLGATLNSAWFMYLKNVEKISEILDYFTSVYSNSDTLETLSQRNAISGRAHLSDMHLLIELCNSKPNEYVDAAYRGTELGIDNNIRAQNGFASFYGHKKVTWRAKQPWIKSNNGKLTRFFCLHFQGPSKFLMQYMNTIESKYLGEHLVDFSNRVAQLPNDQTGQDIKSAYNDLQNVRKSQRKPMKTETTPSKRHIFLDCGGHCGESVLKFIEIYPDHDFYTFEPNPDLSQHVLTNIRTLTKPIFFSPTAVWTHDGHLEFFIGHDQGSTAMHGKVEFAEGVQQVDYTRPVKVPCIDLSAWIARNVRETDELIIKMDVEGAEYEILPRMLADGTIDRVTRLYCEWHHDRLVDVSLEEHNELVQKIESRTSLLDWI